MKSARKNHSSFVNAQKNTPFGASIRGQSLKIKTCVEEFLNGKEPRSPKRRVTQLCDQRVPPRECVVPTQNWYLKCKV